jgi:CubicO group peptidase (beta-lactamase class C family)
MASAAVLAASPVFAQQAALVSAAPIAKPADVSPEILELRRQFLNPPLNALAYRNIDQIFSTQPVPAGASAWALKRNEQPLDFTYQYDGQTYPAVQILERTFGGARLIIKNDRIVYERYRNFDTPSTRFISMSMAKSITSVLIGIAVKDGAIASIDDQITKYVPELKGSAYDGVTIRNALDMKTGVDRNDGAQLVPDSAPGRLREQIFVQNARPAIDEASMVKRKAQPGSVFEYTTLNTTVLGWVLERATKQPLVKYSSQKLWAPMGAEQGAFWMVDGPSPSARALNGLGFNATLRDYGRFGLMVLNNGKANGRQIAPADWIISSTETTDRTPTAPNAETGYHHQWWLDLKTPSAFMALGLAGQYIYIDRKTQTVVVKLSHVPMSNNVASPETMAFLRAASAWTPR